MKTRVWDVPVRMLHWGLALSVAAAAATGGSVRFADLHVGAGVAALSVVVLRIVWGFAGERWSRFSAFGEPPGHTPAASASALAALALVLLLGATGALVLWGEERRGAFAGVVGVREGIAVHAVHDALAWAIGAWLVVHLAGVARESLRERQDLVAGMVDGRKRATVAPVRARGGVAVAMAVGIGAAAVAAVPGEPAPVPTDAPWQRECGDCHVAYPASLLPARSWDALIGADDHFGEALGLDPALAGELRAWALAASAEAGVDEHAVRIARSVPPDAAPLRITGLDWWRDLHRAEPDAGLRCDDCHAGAAEGRFDRVTPRRTE